MSTHSPYRRRSDALKVTVSLCLCYSLCFVLVGAWLRVKSRSYRWDDAVAVAATVSQLSRLDACWSGIDFIADTVFRTIRDPVCNVDVRPRKINGVSVHQLGLEPVELGIKAPLIFHSSKLTCGGLGEQSSCHPLLPHSLHLQRGSSCLSLPLRWVAPAKTHSLRRLRVYDAFGYHFGACA